jgi:hypothetical protein
VIVTGYDCPTVQTFGETVETVGTAQRTTFAMAYFCSSAGGSGGSTVMVMVLDLAY